MKTSLMLVGAAAIAIGATALTAQEDKGSRRTTMSPSPTGTPTPDSSPMRFQGLDRDDSGTVSREEWRGNDTSFRNQDTNGDGVLSGDELRPGNPRPSPSPLASPSAGVSPSPKASPRPSPTPLASPSRRPSPRTR
jgi:hypothetical protein